MRQGALPGPSSQPGAWAARPGTSATPVVPPLRSACLRPASLLWPCPLAGRWPLCLAPRAGCAPQGRGPLGGAGQSGALSGGRAAAAVLSAVLPCGSGASSWGLSVPARRCSGECLLPGDGAGGPGGDSKGPCDGAPSLSACLSASRGWGPGPPAAPFPAPGSSSAVRGCSLGLSSWKAGALWLADCRCLLFSREV